MWSNFDNSMQQDVTGGGFMDDSTAQQNQGEQTDAKRGQNVVPLMIGHLNAAEDADLKLWGNPVRMVSVVSIVRKVEQVTTKVTYELEDETGKINATQWLEADKTTVEPVELNTYVRVYGFLRETAGEKHIMLVRILPVKELAEVLMHLLDVTSVCLEAAKEKTQGIKNNPSLMSSTIANFNDDVNGMTKEQSIIFNIIQSENDTDCGIDRATIKKRAPPNITNKIDDILNFLSNEGHIYTTNTDDHFKTT